MNVLENHKNLYFIIQHKEDRYNIAKRSLFFKITYQVFEIFVGNLTCT